MDHSPVEVLHEPVHPGDVVRLCLGVGEDLLLHVLAAPDGLNPPRGTEGGVQKVQVVQAELGGPPRRSRGAVVGRRPKIRDCKFKNRLIQMV